MRLERTITGSGPTVILIHGVCHRRHAWDAVVPGLAEDFRVVTVDLPGHGASPGLPDANDPAILADVVEEFCDEVTDDGELPHLVGNSLGGWLALELGARGSAASVTALSPAGFFANAIDQARAITVFKALRRLSGAFGPAVPTLARSPLGRAAFMGVFCSRPWRYAESNMVIDAEAILTNEMIDKGIDASFSFTAPSDPELPISVAWGRYDWVLPAYEAGGVRRVFPNADITYPRVGHVPMTDDPAGIAALVRRTVIRADRRNTVADAR